MFSSLGGMVPLGGFAGGIFLHEMPKISTITEEQKLDIICKKIRGRGLSLRISQNKKYTAYIPTAWYQNGRIQIYTDDKIGKASAIASLILHEFGHYLAFIAHGPEHTEKNAWDLAEAVVDRELKPKEFKKIRDICLKLYKKIGQE